MPKQFTERFEEKLLIDLELTHEEINSMSKGEIFAAYLDYEGYIHCAWEIKRAIQNIYGIDLDALEG